jgi:hypothetical protein
VLPVPGWRAPCGETVLGTARPPRDGQGAWGIVVAKTPSLQALFLCRRRFGGLIDFRGGPKGQSQSGFVDGAGGNTYPGREPICVRSLVIGHQIRGSELMAPGITVLTTCFHRSGTEVVRRNGGIHDCRPDGRYPQRCGGVPGAQERS